MWMIFIDSGSNSKMRNSLCFVLFFAVACHLHFCKSQCTLPSGLDPSISLDPIGPYTEGQFIEIFCSSGTQTSGFPFTLCMTGTFSNPLEDVICSLDCESPTTGQDSLNIVGGERMSYPHHDTVSFECATDYLEPLVGSTTSTCNNGIWEPDPSSTMCQAPCMAPFNTDQEGNGDIYAHRDIANFTCMLNTNEALLACNDGIWSDTAFVCPACLRPNDMDPNVLLNSGSTEFTRDEFIIVVCAEGSMMTGGFPFTNCMPDGTFQNSLADVICSLNCIDPAFNQSTLMATDRSYAHHETVMLTCAEGYGNMQGPAQLTCDNGEWSPDPNSTTCEVWCESPLYATPEGTYAPGDSEAFTCLYGDNTPILLTCNMGGVEWDQLLECPEPPTTTNIGTDTSSTDDSTETAITYLTEILPTEATDMVSSSRMTGVTDSATATPLTTDDRSEGPIDATDLLTSSGTDIYSVELTSQGTFATNTGMTTGELQTDVTDSATDMPTEDTTDIKTEKATDMPTADATDMFTDDTTDMFTDDTTNFRTKETTDIPTEEATDMLTDDTTGMLTEDATDLLTEDLTDGITTGPTVDVTFISTMTSAIMGVSTDQTTDPDVITDVTGSKITTLVSTDELFTSVSAITEVTEIAETEPVSATRISDLTTVLTSDNTGLTEAITGITQTSTILITDTNTESSTDSPTDLVTDITTDTQTDEIIVDPVSEVTTVIVSDSTTATKVLTKDVTEEPATSHVTEGMTSQPSTTSLETEATTTMRTEGRETTRRSTTSPIEEGSTALAVAWVIEEVNGTAANYTDDLNDSTSDAYQELEAAVESAIRDLLLQLGEDSLVGIQITGFSAGSIKVNFTLIFSTNFTGNASLLQALLIDAISANGGLVNGSLSPTVLKIIEELITVTDVTGPTFTTVVTTNELFTSVSDITEITEIAETELVSTNRIPDLTSVLTTDIPGLTELTKGTEIAQTPTILITDTTTESSTDSSTDMVTDITLSDLTTVLGSDSTTEALTEDVTEEVNTRTGISTDGFTDSVTEDMTEVVTDESTTGGVRDVTTDISTDEVITTFMKTEVTPTGLFTGVTEEPSTDSAVTERMTPARTEGAVTTKRSTTSPPEEGTTAFDVTWVIEEINGTASNYSDDLSDPTSDAYKTLEAEVTSAIEDLLMQLGLTSAIGIEITGFSSGSIIVDFILTFDANFTGNATALQALLIQAVTENGGFINSTTLLKLIAESIKVTDAASQTATTSVTEEPLTSMVSETTADLSSTLPTSGTEQTEITIEITMGPTDLPSTDDVTNMFSTLVPEDTTEGTQKTENGTSTMEYTTQDMTTDSTGTVVIDITSDMVREMTTEVISVTVEDTTTPTGVTDHSTGAPATTEPITTIVTDVTDMETVTTGMENTEPVTTGKEITDAVTTPDEPLATLTTSRSLTTGRPTTRAKTTAAATEPNPTEGRATTRAATTLRIEPCGSNTCGPQEFCLETAAGSVCECLIGKERQANGECTDGCNNVCDFDTELCEGNTCACRPGRRRDTNGVCANYVEFTASWTIVEVNGTNATFTQDLDDPTTEAYQTLAKAIQNAVSDLLVQELAGVLGVGTFIDVQIIEFQSGSIISMFSTAFTSALSTDASGLASSMYDTISSNNFMANDSSTSTSFLLSEAPGSISVSALENTECGAANVCGNNSLCTEVDKSVDADGFICACQEGYTDVLGGRLSGSVDCRESITPPSSGLAPWEAVIIALSACAVGALLLFFCCLFYFVMVQRRNHYKQKFQEVLRSDSRRGQRQYSYDFDDDAIIRNDYNYGNEERGTGGPLFFAKVIDGSESHGSDVDSALDPHIERYGHSLFRMREPGPIVLPETALVPYSGQNVRGNRRSDGRQEYSPDLSGKGPSVIYNDMAMH